MKRKRRAASVQGGLEGGRGKGSLEGGGAWGRAGLSRLRRLRPCPLAAPPCVPAPCTRRLALSLTVLIMPLVLHVVEFACQVRARGSSAVGCVGPADAGAGGKPTGKNGPSPPASRLGWFGSENHYFETGLKQAKTSSKRKNNRKRGNYWPAGAKAM